MSDPAVLFYTSDFLTGVIDMTMEERGQYITLLCYQHQKGHIKEETIWLLVGSVSVNVLKHFIKDENGLFYNKRMEEEKTKRHNYTESRRENGKKGGRPKKKEEKPYEKPTKNHMDNHMNNHMGNENDNENINNNIIKEIINYLNIRTGQNYKPNTKTTQQHINQRLREGFTIDDFKIVIDKMCVEWMNTEMQKYLRPETLFGTKFESYLNRIIKQTNISLSENDIMKIFN